MRKIEVKIRDILEKLSKDKKIYALVSPFTLSEKDEVNTELKKEMVQEITLMLLEYKKPEAIIRMHKNNELMFFILRMIGNQAYRRNSFFVNKFIKWEKNRETYEMLSR